MPGEVEKTDYVTPLLIAFTCLCAGALTYIVSHIVGGVSIEGSVGLAISVIGVCCTMIFAIYNSTKNKEDIEKAVIDSGIDNLISQKVVDNLIVDKNKKKNSLVKNNLDDANNIVNDGKHR